MDHNENTSSKKLTAKDAAAIAAVAGVVVVSCVVAGKLAVTATDRAIDAVVNTLTLSRKHKALPESK